MYKIRQKDQKELGPYTAEVVRQWITAGRAGPDTQVCKVGEGIWKPLAEFAELQAAPTARSAGEAGRRRQAEKKAERVDQIPAQISGLAVASVVLGILGFLGVTAAIGLVLGIVALKVVARSNGQLRGTGWAIAGTILSGSMLLLAIPTIAGLFLVPLLKERQQQGEYQCLEHVQALSFAIQTFAAQQEGRLPNAATWCDQLIQNSLMASANPAFRCPTQSEGLCDYAFNKHLSGLILTNVPKNAVLLFESDQGWNGRGDAQNIASFRHGMHFVIGFADGSVERVPAWQLPQLRWLPQGAP